MDSFYRRFVACCCGLLILVLGGTAARGQTEDPLESGFARPPREARLRAYWWWLNGNVTKASITRDLEGMAAKGFGGALICDAGGAEQDGNDRVPHGPTFFSPEWRELYKHALREADRLGLEMSLNIQSGWNLGGPMVKAEDAPKRLVWSEVRVSGPTPLKRRLDKPKHPAEFYRDVAVVAYRLRAPSTRESAFAGATARSEQSTHPAKEAADGHPDSYWVSDGAKPGEGPSRERPEWIQLEFTEPLAVNGVSVLGRSGYGPRECELRTSDDGKAWHSVKSFAVEDGRECVARFDKVRSTHFRLVIFSSFDPQSAEAPRNVQIAEVKLLGEKQSWPADTTRRQPLEKWQEKALLRPFGFSAPDTSALLQDLPDRPGEEDLRSREVVDLAAKMDADGSLAWDVPAGDWEIVRIGCTLNQHCRVSTCSDGWQGYALDPFDANAFRSYWQAVVEPLIEDAGPLAGRTLKYLHTDSWEVEVANWTPGLREEFQRRRGYDMWPFLPALTGRIVDSRTASNRFLHDLRKTMGDLAVDNHYRLFVEYAHRHGLQIHPESGGPHAVPIDSLRCLGMDDAPMSEFWARSWRHRVTDENRFFVKQPASAAHTYGRRLVLAEGFTTIGPHWQETLWDNLKPSFDRACCEGLNLLVWHGFVCSPAEMGMPGQQYFAGTHLNPNSRWWTRSGPFLAYLNRCQFLLQRGLFVADAVYYYGDHVPNFTQLKVSDPARVLPGYDYDVATEEVVLARMSVRDGRIVLPDGMSYRVLVLPNHRMISLPVLRKVKELTAAGATVIGPRPEFASGLRDYLKSDAEVAALVKELWGDADGKAVTEHRFGQGRILCGKTAREVLMADGVAPDFGFTPVASRRSPTTEPKLATDVDYIHRRDGGADIYFVCNRTGSDTVADLVFRVSGKAPELWDPTTGQTRMLPAYSQADGRTTVPMQFAPYGSWFVVFRKPAGADAAAGAKRNFPVFTTARELSGEWTVRFDPKWGGPASAEFPRLVSWTKRPEDGIRFYSGTATYVKTFDLPQTPMASPPSRVYLDLGEVRQLAEVRLNGKALGILWAMPFRVDVTDVLRPAGNELEIDVVNFWPNRIIGDASLPPEQRRTKTNIRKLTASTALVESGLMGPVTLQVADR